MKGLGRTLFLLFLSTLPLPATAQTLACTPATDGAIPGSRAREQLRSGHLTDSVAPAYTWMVQRTSDGRARCPATPADGNGVALLPLHAVMQNRSAYPDDRNNGAFWSGKGLNAGVSAGAKLRWGALTVRLAPTLVYSQNTAFPLQNVPFDTRSEYASPYHSSLDWPQRFGDEAVSRLDPGQSVVRLDYRGAAVGVSTENLWWGPGQRNALLLSSTAAGFPHVFIGTSRPAETPIGAFEVEAVWARLQESEWFDTIPGNDERQLSAIVGTWSPSFLPGLQLGAARAFHFALDDGELSFSKYAFPFFEGFLKKGLEPDGPTRGAENQIASFFLRWAIPSGFEAYWELVRDDHSANLQDLLAQPRHAGGFLVGFQKVYRRSDAFVRVAAEHMNITRTQKPEAGRPDGTIYRHSSVSQGHTHRGSMLGAATGPGSTGTYVAADWWNEEFGLGGYAERVVRDDDTYYRRWADNYSYYGQDLEWTLGGRGHLTRGSLRLEAEAAYSRRRNMLFIRHDIEFPTGYLGNWLLETRLSWAPDVRLTF